MRVIREGSVIIKEQVKDCKRCESQFLYHKDDILVDRTGTYIVCPCCKALIVV